MIVASFRSQYGIRLATDLPNMKWREFAAYMSGLDGKTPLGRIISIRSETDGDVLKQFTPEQRRIRREWQLRKAKQIQKKDMDAVIDMFKNVFLSMAEKPTTETIMGGTKDVEADLS